MATFRGSRYLRCFYCNQRSKTQYDGRIRQFLCTRCDSMNYLDENGEITDPPLSRTTAPPPATQYAIPRSTSPETPTPSRAIFCAKCLKNQHLFTSSLAQYLPEDPNHPEYAVLERNYYKFRAGLERRYPQMCAECEPRVLGKLKDAGYTAKTDHLRRVMDRSRLNREKSKQRTLLDVVDISGRSLWWSGLVLQLVWHLAVIGAISEVHATDESRAWTSVAVRGLHHIYQVLPDSDQLVWYCFLVTLLASWWNPRFAQVVRGFSRPILGLPHWYIFQGLITLIRFTFPKLMSMGLHGRDQPSGQLGAHLCVALFSSYTCFLALRSVKIDTSPLFGSSNIATSPARTAMIAQEETGTKSLSNILDEILTSPSLPTSLGAVTPSSASSVASFARQPGHNQPISRSVGAVSTLDGLPTQPQPQPQPLQYDVDMDWTPTQPQPAPALRGSSGNGHKSAFGQPQPNISNSNGHFWAKLPPAPKGPAQRLVQLPAMPSKPVSIDKAVFSRQKGLLGFTNKDTASGGDSISFATTRFLPPESPSDPRNSLADILNRSFSLGPDDPADEKIPGIGTNKSTAANSSFRWPRSLDGIFLGISLGVWLYCMREPPETVFQFSFGSIAVSSMVTLRFARASLKDARQMREPSPAILLGAILCIVEIIAAVYVGLQLWAAPPGSEGCRTEGLWTISIMFAHQLWNILF